MIVNPYTQGSFPGLVLKAWALVTSAGALVKSSNVTSITKGAAGVYTVNFTVAMAAANYAVKVQPHGGSIFTYGGVGTKAVGSCGITVKNDVALGTGVDAMFYAEFWE